MFDRIWNWIVGAAHHLFDVLGEAAEETIEKALPAFDALIQKYLPLAIEQVKAAMTNPDLLDGAQKRSHVIGVLKEQLQTDGHNIMADGIENACRLLVEMALSMLKMATGTQLKSG